MSNAPQTLASSAALDFLMSRRSRPAKTLVAPAPTRAQLLPLLTAAARTPDHGKLEPWRFVVIEKPAMARLAELTVQAGARLGKSEADIIKGRSQFDLAWIRHPAGADAITRQQPTLRLQGQHARILP